MTAIIKTENLTKKFKDFIAVDNISLEVQAGEIFAFLGPNGAGKTTTIKMLTTLLKPTSGHILINEKDPIKNPLEARRSFGIIFQDHSIDDELTALENMEFHGVLYGMEKKLIKSRTEELLNIVELWDRKDSFVKTFSGGMKRRLEIARGLLHHPKIIFLDEPTLGLDPQTRNHIWQYIKKLNEQENITVFFTTHYMEEADRIANRVAVIDRGKIIALDTPDKLKKQTNTNSLEEAFLLLTGKQIREEAGSGLDQLRMQQKMWKR
jgi:ABC-2 type transport system ATP-binding protein